MLAAFWLAWVRAAALGQQTVVLRLYLWFQVRSAEAIIKRIRRFLLGC